MNTSLIGINERILELEIELAQLRIQRNALEEQHADLSSYLISACSKYGVRPEDVQGTGREQPLPDARAYFAVTAHSAGYSMVAIARLINKDRSSVHNMIERATWYNLIPDNA
jgi:hypothetical protein